MTQPYNYWTLIEYQVGRDKSYRRLNKYKCICGQEKNKLIIGKIILEYN